MLVTSPSIPFSRRGFISFTASSADDAVKEIKPLLEKGIDGLVTSIGKNKPDHFFEFCQKLQGLQKRPLLMCSTHSNEKMSESLLNRLRVDILL